MAGVLALAPFHTGIVTGNVALVAIELAVIAIWTARRHRDLATAVLLAASVGLKPQIGLAFVAYYLVRRRWRVCAGTLALLALLFAVGAARLEFGHTPWLQDYLRDNRVLLQTGILANFTNVNPTRFGLINLQVVLYSILRSVPLANAAAAVLAAVLFLLWLLAVARRNTVSVELLDLSAVAVLSLLPIYHRFYDAAVLVLPLCWVVVSFRRARILSAATLLLMLPFLIPGGTLLQSMENAGHFSPAVTSRWWWEAVVMPHQVWTLFFLSLLLLYEMIWCSPDRFAERDSVLHGGSPSFPSATMP